MENPVAPPSSQPSMPPQPPVPPAEPELFPKSWAIGLGLLMLLVVSGLAYLGYQNYQLRRELAEQSVLDASSVPVIDETADWETYTGDGFSFKYPESLSLSPSSGEEGVYYLETPNYQPFVDNSYQIQITITPNNQGIPNVLPPIDTNTPEGTFTDKRDFMDFNGARGIVTTYTEEWANYKRYTLFSDTLKVDFFGTGNNHSILDEILSTFEFTQESDETADWQTYTSKDNSFSFKYPAESILKMDSLSIDGSIEFSNFILLREKTTGSLSEYVNRLKDQDLPPEVTGNSIQWIGFYKNAPTYYVSILENGYVYSLGLTPFDLQSDTTGEAFKLCDTILSTFRFIN